MNTTATQPTGVSPTPGPSAAPSGPLMWLSVIGSIPLWIAHLGIEISLVPLREQHPGVVWLMHALTVLLAALVLVLMRASWNLAHISDEPELSPTPAGRTVFLGIIGLIFGGLDLLLIVYEGVIIAVMRASL